MGPGARGNLSLLLTCIFALCRQNVILLADVELFNFQYLVVGGGCEADDEGGGGKR